MPRRKKPLTTEQKLARQRELWRKYYAANIDKERERKHEWYVANRDKVLEHQREYHAANPEIRRKYRAAHS